MRKFAVKTLGCKVNTYESQSIVNSLLQKGYEEIDFKEKADIYIIFTCAVTNTAESKSRKMINQAIRQNPQALICVIGCLVQINANQLAANDKIDILVGSSGKDKVPELIDNYFNDQQRMISITDVSKQVDFDKMELNTYHHQTRAFLKIQDGCNQFCSYCIIPYARGRERSLAMSDVIASAQKLSEHHKEIVLSGIHTGRYGKEFNITLAQLLKNLLVRCPKLERIRISSIEISEIDDELIELLANEPKIAKHLHIPLQSGDDEILKLMNRPYTTEQFATKVAYIRSKVKNIAISTDLIIGFPNESLEHFERTCDFVESQNFAFMHIFPYSRKKNTVADKMNDHITEIEKKRRVKIMEEIANRHALAYKSNFVGKDVEVIVEHNDHNDTSFGHTSEYLPIVLDKVYPANTLVKAVITHYANDILYAKEK